MIPRMSISHERWHSEENSRQTIEIEKRRNRTIRHNIPEVIQQTDNLLLVQLRMPKVISEPTTGRWPDLGREKKKRRKSRAQWDSRIIILRGGRESWSAKQQADRRKSTKRPAEDEQRVKQTVKEEKTKRKDEGKKRRDRDNSGGEVNVCIQLQYGIMVRHRWS